MLRNGFARQKGENVRLRLEILIATCLLVGSCAAQTNPRAQIQCSARTTCRILVDLADVHADDVLQPKREQEIADLVAVLKNFAPTKVAIEAEYGSKRVNQEYADYLAGKYTLTRNETNQIGYRLAKEFGHKQVYPVGVMEDFPLAV